MPRLGVNIDHIATLRQVRNGIEPEPCFAALVCQTAGADSIVAHLREDRRHIKERDLYILKEVVKVKFNLEMSLAQDIIEIACKVKPDQVTIVPEKRRELTTEGGLDVEANFNKIKQALNKFKKYGISVSLFIDPDKKQIDNTKKLGIKFIELHTGKFADARSQKDSDRNFNQIVHSVNYAAAKKITVFAGHGLNYYNAGRIAKIKGIEELNIGYSIICRSVLIGLEQAVRQMKELTT